MKSIIQAVSLALVFAVASAGFVPTDADARRLGGGSSAGMQRSMPSRAPTGTPPSPAAPAQPAQASPAVPGTPAAPAAAPRRSWLGPIAGLAAGLGIAALMSHLGFGEGFGNIVMLALLAFVAFAVIRFLMARFAGSRNGSSMATPNGFGFGGSPQTAGGSASTSGGPLWPSVPAGGSSATPSNSAGSAALTTPVSAAPPIALPAGFDAAGFERIAKLIFIRMQAANDAADLNDLRAFTTPEMFAAARLDLQDRNNAAQTTDVVRIDAQVLEVASEADRQIVSVRFHGLIREEKDGAAEPFDEIWHLTRPLDGSREWAIAGIQQTALN